MADEGVVQPAGRPRWLNPMLQVLLVAAAAASQSALWCVFTAVLWALVTAVRATSPHPPLPAGEHVDGVRLAEAAPSELAPLLAVSPRLGDTAVFVSRAEPGAALSSPAGLVLGWSVATSVHAPAVVAHELGHVAARDWLRNGAWIAAPSAVLLTSAVLFSAGAATPLVLAASTVTMWLLTLCAAASSRRAEFAADRFAADAVGETAVADMLRAWCGEHRATSWFDTHPTLRARLAALATPAPPEPAAAG